jgi:2-polyprenyl-6-hydroxyphenyl methylase/3-demethylubiquinone-9 3-methyltransferase
VVLNELENVIASHVNANVAPQVVEHVVEPTTFIHDCAAAVKPGGLLVVSTLNRTLLSWAFGVVVAEQILG